MYFYSKAAISTKINKNMNRKTQILETVTNIFEISDAEKPQYPDGSDPKRVARLAKLIGGLIHGKKWRTERAVEARSARGRRGPFPKFKSDEKKD